MSQLCVDPLDSEYDNCSASSISPIAFRQLRGRAGGFLIRLPIPLARAREASAQICAKFDNKKRG